jgi:hypothetical protein
MINMFSLDRHILHAVDARHRALGDDLEWAGQAAEAFVGLEVLGRDPPAAGFAVELVEGRRADRLAGAVGGRQRQLDHAGVEVVDRGEDDRALGVGSTAGGDLTGGVSGGDDVRGWGRTWNVELSVFALSMIGWFGRHAETTSLQLVGLDHWVCEPQ